MDAEQDEDQQQEQQQKEDEETRSISNLKDELERTERALFYLKSGIEESSRYQSQEARSNYLDRFLKDFEQKYGGNDSSSEMSTEADQRTDIATTRSLTEQSVDTEPDYSDVESSTRSMTTTMSALQRDLVKIDRSAVIQEFKQLLDQNRTNLDFLFILLREIRFIDTNTARGIYPSFLVQLMNSWD